MADNDEPTIDWSILKDLTLELIEEKAGGDIDFLANLYLGQFISSATDDSAQPYAVVKKWLPLFRKQEFFEAVAMHIQKMQQNAPDSLIQSGLGCALIPKELLDFSDDQIEKFFLARNTPEKLEAVRADNVGQEYFLKAKAASSRGDLQSADVYFQRAVKAFENTSNLNMLGKCYLDWGGMARAGRQHHEALELITQARSLFKQVGDAANLAVSYNNLGYLLLDMNHLDEAYEQGEIGLGHVDPLDTHLNQLVERLARLMLEAVRRKQDPPREKANQLLALADFLRSVETRQFTARCLLHIAHDLLELNCQEDAYQISKDAFRLVDRDYFPEDFLNHLANAVTVIGVETGRTYEKVSSELNELFGVPSNVRRLGDLQTALVQGVWTESLSLEAAIQHLQAAHREVPFDAESVLVLEKGVRKMLATIGPELPKAEDVLRAYEVSLRLLMAVAELIGDPAIASAVVFDLAVIHDKQGQFQNAAEAFGQAAELASRAGLADFKTSMLLNVAGATHRGGDMHGAARCLCELLQEVDTSGLVHREPEVLAALSRVHVQLGDPEQGEAYAARALRVLRGLGDSTAASADPLGLESELCSRLGMLCKRSSRFSDAIEHYERALSITRSQKNPADEAIALGNLAGVYLDLADLDRAQVLYERAYEIVRRWSVLPSYHHIYSGRAMIFSAIGRKDEAREMAQLVEEDGASPDDRAIALSILNATAENDVQRADAASRIREFLRTTPDPVHRMALVYQLLKNPGLSAQERGEWVDIIRTEARGIQGIPGIIWNERVAELLSDSPGGLPLAREHLHGALRNAEEIVTSNPSGFIRRQVYAQALSATRDLVRLTDDTHEQLELILRTKARGTLNDIWSPVTTISEVQEHLLQCEQAVLLIEFFERDGESWVYLVSQEGLQAVERLSCSTPWLSADGRAVWELGDPDKYRDAWRSDTWNALSTEFGNLLSRYTDPDVLILVVPSGFWHLLPLHACRCEGQPLIVRNPIVYGPSSSVLSRCGDPGRQWTNAIAVGVDFEGEARLVADWFGGELIDRRLAVPDFVALKMKRQDVVHFSTHGVYILGGEQSGVRLRDESWLTPQVLESHSTGADLVFVSACETAVNFVTPGGDLVGLDVALLNMGAVSVLATLWPVRADATENLVEAFYRNLTGRRRQKQKLMSKAHALQAAMIELLHGQDFAHPYNWAPFKLSGGWL